MRRAPHYIIYNAELPGHAWTDKLISESPHSSLITTEERTLNWLTFSLTYTD